MLRHLLFCVFLFSCLFTVAQPRPQPQPDAVKGRVWDAKTLAPIIGAEIRLLHLKDSTGRVAYTDSIGRFIFPKVANGLYEISTYTIGYQTEKKKIEMTGENPRGERVEFPLQVEALEMKEITIVGKAPISVQKGDTTQYNAEAFKVQPNASAEEMVAKIPGVTMQNGTVTAQGENVKQVLVDGKPFFGEDPSAVLKNLPAEMIDKVQVYDRSGNQGVMTGFDDANTAKIMNIVTKLPFRNGTFGKAYAGAGYGDEARAKAGANLNIFKGDKRMSFVGMANNVNEQNFSTEDLIGVIASSMGNMGGGGMGRPPGGMGGGGRPQGGGMGRGGMGRGMMDMGSSFLVGQQNGISTVGSLGFNLNQKLNKKWKFAGSIFTNALENENLNNTLREYVLPQANGLVYGEKNTISLNNQSVRSNLRFTFNADSMNSFIFNPRISFQRANNLTWTEGYNRNAEKMLSETNNQNNLKPQTAWNLGGELTYSHRFLKKGRTFSVELSGNHSPSMANRDIQTRNISLIDSMANDSSLQNWGTKHWTYNLSTNFTYTEPINEKWAAIMTYTPAYSRSFSNRQAYSLAFENPSIKTLDTTMSNLFYNQYFTQNAGLGLRYQVKAGSITFNGNYQYANLYNDQTFPTSYQLTRNFQNFLPSITARFNLDKHKSLRVRYFTRTNSPSVSQLQPIVNNSNPLQISSGNPDLLQEYRHTLMTRYTTSNPQVSSSFFAFIMANYTQHYIGNATFIASKDTVIQGNNLAEGSQFTQPVNLDRQLSVNTAASYTFVISPIKSNLTLSPALSYSLTPALINGQRNEAHTPTAAFNLSLTSNISEKVDFTVSSNSSLNLIRNTLETSANSAYFLQSSMAKVNLVLPKTFFVQTDLTHQLYSGLAASFNQNFFLWNMGFGKKFGKSQNSELKLYVFDILKQNNNIQRNVTETYREDLETRVLQRYAMLVFTYNFKKAGNVPK
ncbi:MAG: outer membrane beta-barrel protein [Bacteroidia bacterium]